MAMSCSQARLRASGRKVDSGNVEPPSGMYRLQDIIDGHINVGRVVTVAGVVTDVLQPMATSRSDFKMTLKLLDLSTEAFCLPLQLVIFWPEDHMPTVNHNDVILAHQVKVQNYGGFSLITNHQSDVLVYSAKSMPRYPRDAEVALQPCPRPLKKAVTAQEHSYVARLWHGLDKTELPDEQTFQARAVQSLNVKSKFRLLKDIEVNGAENSSFADLIVRVVREPFDIGDKITLWVSDYTENDAFFHHTVNDASASGNGGHSGDATEGWTGPGGKRSFQVTAWDQHADLIRNDVHAGMWLKLRNVHITHGHNAENLEGKLRSNQADVSDGRLCVEVLDNNDNYHANSVEWKDAVRRMVTYDKQAKQQLKQLRRGNGENGVDGSANGRKRKADGLPAPKGNSRERRMAKRAATAQAVEEKEEQLLEHLNLNENVKCENANQGFSPVSELFEQHTQRITVDGCEIDHRLPFVNLKYRCAVRVVDFRPPRLEDFALSRAKTDADLLSDMSDDGSSSGDDDDRPSSSVSAAPENHNMHSGGRIWEWRFALQLEDASQPDKTPSLAGDRVWVIVHNEDAQMLTDLDATDLRSDPEQLSRLSNQMAILWGDLEEKKRAQRRAAQERADQAVAARPSDGKMQKPDVNSSDAEESDHEGKAASPMGVTKEPVPASQTVRNRPFACCIRQYGVKERAKEGELDDAGEGKKWERKFGLFGARIPLS